MMDRYRLIFMAQSVNSSYWPVDDLVVGLEDVRGLVMENHSLNPE